MFKSNLRASLASLSILVAFTLPACSQQPPSTVPKSASGKKTVAQEVAVIKTDLGTIVFKFYEKEAPRHIANFKKLAREGFYNGTTFHRVMTSFMIQGGDPNSKDSNPMNDGSGGPGYTIPAEISPLRYHQRGAVAAARLGDEVNPKKESSGCQFYIVQGRTFTPDMLKGQELGMNQARMQQLFQEFIVRRENAAIKNKFILFQQNGQMDSLQTLSERIEPLLASELEKRGLAFHFSEEQIKTYGSIGGAPHLDGDYTVFGQVVSGMEVADKIAAAPVDGRSRPIDNIVIESVTIETMDVEE